MVDTGVADELVGTLIDGRYRVRSRVARGGMATVYTAVDERLERTVALKIVHSEQALEPQFLDRFVHEARAIARLTHPNVVAAYDQGHHRGLPYLVMEYVPGQTLREILRRRHRLTPVEALAVTEQMLAAIAAAHRAGLVHRDIKPENVLVTASPSGGTSNLVDCVVKVADFGLAQAVQASSAPGGTDPGTLLATAAYVAPELVAEGRADPRSDVYSTGIVLYEMLTGQVPYDDPVANQVAWRHVDEDVPAPSRQLPGLPPAVDNLVLRATRREPGHRHSDAGALLSEVQAVRDQIASHATSRPAAADQTMVISAVTAPPTATGAERPAWARLPSDRQTAPPRRAGARRAAPATGNTRRVAAASGAGATSHVRGQNRWSRPGPHRTIMIGLVVAVVLALAAGGWWLGFGRWMPAPELVGLPEAEAVARAQQAGLRVTYTEPEHDEQIDDGRVLRQQPTGRVLKGGTLTLTLSLGPEIRQVPDVVGADLELARRQLEALGLVVVEGEPDYSNGVPEGRVLAIDPPVGEQVQPGEQVTITISRGRAPIQVPALVGMPVEQAQTLLAQRGLTAEVTQVQDNAPAGQVLAQDPPSGTGAEAGDLVRLEISEGPPTRPVPDVANQPCQRAVQLLTDAGFEVNHGALERGRVRFQSPSAGTGLPPGSEVTIFCL